MTYLYLIRHGANVDGWVEGKYGDLGLSEVGVRQSELLRDHLAGRGYILADVLISSPERRARETAEIIAPAIKQPIIFDEEVEEWRSDDGTIDPEDFVARWQAVPPNQKSFYRWFPTGENRLEFVTRVQLTLNRIVQEHAGKTIVIVSHGAFIQSAFVYFFRYSDSNFQYAVPEISHTSVTVWHQADPEKHWTLKRSNDCRHLE